MDGRPDQRELFANLEALEESNFPKQCRACGREFVSADEFLLATHQVRQDHSGLKQGVNEDGSPIVDIFRNCPCGSTLLESFRCRRDTSLEGRKRRARFDELLNKLVSAGVDRKVAHRELLRLMRGQPHAVLELIHGLEGDTGESGVSGN